MSSQLQGLISWTGDQRNFIARTKRYLKRLRARVIADGTDPHAFMTGANAFVKRMLNEFDDMELYTTANGIDDDGMIVACHYLNGTRPRVLLWAKGCEVAARSSLLQP